MISAAILDVAGTERCQTVATSVHRSLDILQHPIVRSLPPEAIDCVAQHGHHAAAPAQDALEDGPAVRFILSGAIGIFPTPRSACVAMVGPGGLHGLEHCFCPPPPEQRVALLDSDWLEVAPAALAQVMGRRWAERMFAHQATGRLRNLAAEAACNARHPVPQRLARWLLRLHHAAGSPHRLGITQSLLGDILGVQRTTINAALGGLHRSGVIRNTRGRITITDHGGLRQVACECGQRLETTEQPGRHAS